MASLRKRHADLYYDTTDHNEQETSMMDNIKSTLNEKISELQRLKKQVQMSSSLQLTKKSQINSILVSYIIDLNNELFSFCDKIAQWENDKSNDAMICSIQTQKEAIVRLIDAVDQTLESNPVFGEVERGGRDNIAMT